jgi:large subunit ribosomal protein L9
MDIVLLERVEHLGKLGDVVKVKPGYARNYLLPQKKALRATKSNMAYFEQRKADLQALNDKSRAQAEAQAGKVKGLAIVVIRQASEAGQLYGSVAARDIANGAAEQGVTIERRQVVLAEPIKALGIFPVKVTLHPEVSVEVTVNVARSSDEAVTQADRSRPAPVEAEDDQPYPAETPSDAA